MRDCPCTRALEDLVSRDEATPSIRRHVSRCAFCVERLAQIKANSDFLARIGKDIAEAIRGHPGEPPRKGLSIRADAIDGYEFVEEIARGGQGIVYRAIQTETKRPTAIKTLLAGRHSGPRQYYRFEREIELAAGLRHPNIVTVFQSGLMHHGDRFVAMEYVDGVPIDDYVLHVLGEPNSGGRTRNVSVMRLMLQVVGGVGHAHTNGVIHRDLKPSNVLVDRTGTARILDFGLARAIGFSADETFTGDFVGTPAYAAPEQLLGDIQHADARADVYSLGVLMYRLLTGQAPYPSHGSLALIAKHATETVPVPPSRYVRRLSMDIETIVLRCLAKDPIRRYANATAIAEDIASYLQGHPISARRDSAGYVLRMLVRRHRVASFAMTCVVSTVLLATLGFALLVADLEISRRELVTSLSISNVQLARMMAERGDGEQAEALLWREAFRSKMMARGTHYNSVSGGQLRSAWSLMEYYARLPRVMRVETVLECTTAGFLSDSHAFWAIDNHGTHRTWALDGRLIAEFPGPPLLDIEEPTACMGSRNGHYISVRSGHRLRAWDVRNGQYFGSEISVESNAHGALFDDSGRFLMTHSGSRSGRVDVWDAVTGDIVFRYDDMPGIHMLLNDGAGVPILMSGVSISGDHRIVMRRSPDWAAVSIPLHVYPHKDPVLVIKSPTVSADGRYLAAAVESVVYLFDVSDVPVLLAMRDLDTLLVERFCFHDSGEFLIALDHTGLLMRLSLPDLNPVCKIPTSRRTRNLATSPALDLVVIAQMNSGVAVYEPQETPWLVRVESTPVTHASIACAADGTVAWGDDLGTLHVRHPLGGEVVSFPGVHDRVITSVSFSPDGQRIVSTGFDGRIVVRDVDGTSERVVAEGLPRGWCVRFSPDQRVIAGSFQDGTIRLWSLDDEREPRVHSYGASRVPMIEFSPDGRLLLSASYGERSSPVLVDVGSGRIVHRLVGHQTRAVRAVAWSPDGLTVATAGDDRTVRLWDVATGRLLRKIPGLPYGPYGMRFDPTGTLVFTAGPGKSIIVLDPHEGVELAKLDVHKRSVFSIAISPDGTKLFTSGEDPWIGISDLERLRSYILANAAYWEEVVPVWFADDPD